MNSNGLYFTFIFLLAACLVVPLVKRFKLGAVLGYVLAGIAIGPQALGLINNAEAVMHFAEFGVVMMLFLIGLELEPPTLWRLRRAIAGLGGLQVAATAALITAISLALGLPWQTALTAGLALSLSSTALVLQMLQEKQLLQTQAGENAFAVLLFQDIAVIPILLLLPLLGYAEAPQNATSLIAHFPGWAQALTVAGVIALIAFGGRAASQRVFHFIAKTNQRELFTAISLALVVGTALLMQSIGVSPALGAFIAGVVLANSEYRRTLETDIEPFKGLLLGLFFISVGMGMDFSLLARQPWEMAAALAGLLVVKSLVLLACGRLFGLQDGQNTLFALVLSQGGEFAFVLFQFARGLGLFSAPQADFLTLLVALSMAATPFLMMFNDAFIIPRFMSRLPQRNYDSIHEQNPVIIAGYGRFGQVVGRFLSGQGIGVTVLEKDPDQVELIRRFGASAYFGDASRLDLLRNAGAEHAKLLVIAVDDADKGLEILQMAKQHFPNLQIFARARNRRHAGQLHKAGADYFHRELFDSSLAMAQKAAIALGQDETQTAHKAELFAAQDRKTLMESFPFYEKEPELISFSRKASGEMERILREDLEEAV